MRFVRVGSVVLLAMVLAARIASAKDAESGFGGRVIDSDGNPVARALVLAAVAGETRRAVTDVNGSFTFMGLEPGRHEVVARAIGYEPATRVVEVPAVAPRSDLVLLRQAVAERDDDPGATFTKSITSGVGGQLSWSEARFGSIRYSAPSLQLGLNRTITTTSTMPGGSLFTSNIYGR